jgi:hypothetical protein
VGVFSQKLIKEHSFLLQRKKRDFKKMFPTLVSGSNVFSISGAQLQTSPTFDFSREMMSGDF